ncbi:MAG: hypothetical protein ACRC0X_09920 [Brevinema sp.]
MYKTKSFVILIAVFFFTLPTYSLKYILTPFRLNNYVYYEILYKIEGIAPAEFSNVTIIEETSNKLVFEYNGQQYTATNIAKGAIYVNMPEGRSDRYLTRKKVPSIILSQYVD